MGEKIVRDDRINMITFTGSPAVGMRICQQAGLKRVTLELGSNSAVIIDQGVQVDKIIRVVYWELSPFQGQVCISLQRIYVHEEVYDLFVEKFITATKKLTLGDPMDPKRTFLPL